ncbi:tannase/feruloyl esterase family alpha/beta hydrolase [Arthrobacter sp. S39]|uniref:tannase/feruloyl esterase family alpha/beta hydrolase n=1 Tax=Arthrobacter sp. S39 TaxID=2509720 RepID=UPI0013EFB81E|nr:tannase/feruloyl esterase family alpha/beta hydrolase [Arthrobacter sp. S39]
MVHSNSEIAPVTLAGDGHQDIVRLNCNVQTLQAGLAHRTGVSVVFAQVNESGFFDSPAGRIERLPAFCDIRVDIVGHSHTARVRIWAPLAWNGRFLATAGGGNRTENEWVTDPEGTGVETYDMAPTLASSIRRGFAAATTDAGVRDERDFAWGLDIATGEIDRELATNWHHKATKDMADAAKDVLTELYTIAPSYSYLVGTSGGGRQTMVTAQMYPDLFDGYWASCPAVNWSHMSLTGLWPALVMKELGNVVTPDKFEAFRRYALEAIEGASALEDGFLTTLSFPTLDAYSALGRDTEGCVLTELDAEIMNRIWAGPRRRNGEALWYGLPVGADTWGTGVWGIGWIGYEMRKGATDAFPLSYATDWAGAWIQRVYDWDWRTCSITEFEELFDRSVGELAEYDCADEDFSGLKASGGRMLLTHSTGDGLIPPQGTVQYHERIAEALGGDDAAAESVRFFLTPGGGHSSTADGYGLSISLDEGLSALIEWVESGVAPEVLIARRISRTTGEIEMTRPVCRYPLTPQYIGGDRRLATSFQCPARDAAVETRL